MVINMNLKTMKLIKKISDKIDKCKKENDSETIILLKDILLLINKQNKIITDLKKDLFICETNSQIRK